MSFLENLEGFLPNVSVAESPGALVFPSRRLWDELKKERNSPLFLGPTFHSLATPSRASGFLIKLCILDGIKLRPTENQLYAGFRSEMQWAYEGLGWNPSDFENLQQLNVPRAQIWTPSISGGRWSSEISRSEVVLETQYNTSGNRLVVRSVIDSIQGFPPLLEHKCGSDKKLRKQYGEFELSGEPELGPNTWRANYVFKFVRNPTRIKSTVVRPAACLTILNAFSYRVTSWRVSYCCLLMISSIIISMSLFKELHAKTHRIPHIVFLLFSSTLSIVVGLALAILFESGHKRSQIGRKFELHSKWVLLIPSALIFSWLMIQ